MTKRIVLAGVLGGIAMFIWTSLAHMVLPIGQTNVREIPNESAVLAARKALDAHIADLNGELAPMRLLPVACDFPAAIKSLRSIDSMQDALDTALAGAKIAAGRRLSGRQCARWTRASRSA